MKGPDRCFVEGLQRDLKLSNEEHVVLTMEVSFHSRARAPDDPQGLCADFLHSHFFLFRRPSLCTSSCFSQAEFSDPWAGPSYSHYLATTMGSVYFLCIRPHHQTGSFLGSGAGLYLDVFVQCLG